MKNKKFWIFIALIILVVFLNHMFRWSEYLGNTENLTFLETLIEENLAAAIAVYLAVTVSFIIKLMQQLKCLRLRTSRRIA